MEEENASQESTVCGSFSTAVSCLTENSAPFTPSEENPCPTPPRPPSPGLEDEREPKVHHQICGVKQSSEGQRVKDLVSPVESNPGFPDEVASKFHIKGKIGEGTFSSVYLSELREFGHGVQFALKLIVPTTLPIRTENEIRFLRTLDGKHNVMPLIAVIRQHANIVLVMPYFSYQPFTWYFKDMSAEELRLYASNLFSALAHVHRFQIIHRDIKPANFLYDRQRRAYRLIDFGLAQSEQKPVSVSGKSSEKRPNKHSKTKLPSQLPDCPCFGRDEICQICIRKPLIYAPRAGTPGFRAPEILLRHPSQSTALDVWSVGVILLSIASGRYPFFRATEDCEALAEIMQLLGTHPVCNAVQKMTGKKLVINKGPGSFCPETVKAHNLRATCEELRSAQPEKTKSEVLKADTLGDNNQVPCGEGQKYSDNFYVLLRQVLLVNPVRRISAENALLHPYFNEGGCPPPAP